MSRTREGNDDDRDQEDQAQQDGEDQEAGDEDGGQAVVDVADEQAGGDGEHGERDRLRRTATRTPSPPLAVTAPLAAATGPLPLAPPTAAALAGPAGSSPAAAGATVPEAMTAKQQLLERVGAFSEEEAAETLRLLDRRADPVARFFDDAPLEDEPISDEEEAAVQEAREEIARGETVPLEEILREFE